MSYWHKLSPDLVNSFYRIPKEIAKNDENIFYGSEITPFDGDGPWHLLAFLRDTEFPDYIVFQIYEVVPEAQEYEPFNPLTEPGGYLYLSKKKVLDLIELLYEFQTANQVDRRDEVNKEIFSLLDATSAQKFKVSPDWLSDVRRECYYQVENPLSKIATKEIATLLVFSTGKKGTSPTQLFFRISQFELDALSDSSFNPLEHGIARIYLNQKGFQELILLLKRQLNQQI